jgi:ubiquinone/menaquinone biosynthesis C-methylase UbiE
MTVKGDSERQAFLRNRMIKKKKKAERSTYVSKILAVLKPHMRLLDIGCGTAHIIEELAECREGSAFVGLDVSPAMLKAAAMNAGRLSNVMLVEADGLELPFADDSFNIVITRLAEYSPKATFRVLKRNGLLFEYGLGPDVNREFVGFFKDRIDKESFFFPKNLSRWKDEVSEPIKNAGFVVESVKDFREDEYHAGVEELLNLAKMVPLVKDFDREKDRRTVEALARKYRDRSGIRTTWHYFILEARKL